MANPIVEQVIEEMRESLTVQESARVFIRSVPGLIQTAKEQVLANGATEAQLQPLTDLKAQLDSSNTETVAALVENTPEA